MTTVMWSLPVCLRLLWHHYNITTGTACRLALSKSHATTYWQPARTKLASNLETNPIQAMYASSQRPDWTCAGVHVKASHGHSWRSLQDCTPLVTQKWFCPPVTPGSYSVVCFQALLFFFLRDSVMCHRSNSRRRNINDFCICILNRLHHS